MTLRARVAWISAGAGVAALGLAMGAGLALWVGLDTEQRTLATALVAERWPLLGLAALLALLLPAGLLYATVVRSHVQTPKRMAEETRIIAEANPAHRLSPASVAEWDELVEAVNGLAARFQTLTDSVEAKIKAARASAEDEKNQLASLMSQLTQSVLVCHVDGRILLYNNSARQLLGRTPGGRDAVSIGLGRSIFPFIERNLFTHALETIADRIRRGERHPIANVVTTTAAGQLIRVKIGPVAAWRSPDAEEPAPGERPQIVSVVLTLEDVTGPVEAAGRCDALLQSITGAGRAALANIRAAVETMMAYPDMEPERQQQFIRIISEEVTAFSDKLREAESEFAESLQTEWLMDDIRASDLVAAAQRKIEHKLGIRPAAELIEDSIWLRVDSYSLIQAISYLASRLKYELDSREFALRLGRAGRFVELDLIWAGAHITVETWHSWETQPLRMGGEASPLNLRTVMQRHAGEAWYQIDEAGRRAFFRLVVPARHKEASLGPDAHTGDASTGLLSGDVFRAPPGKRDLDKCRLQDLAVTVFSLGTTGPDPAAGDAVFAIGAVRIVDGRLLRHEVFEQLVDPGRMVAAATAAGYGLEPSMLEGQPALESVLPAFHRFCQDTVLVAYRADRDIRFLRSKEVQCGARFRHPVLDVPLLSAAVHPNLGTSSFEALAQRLGVATASQATTLERAIATAEVFLKLVPLLQERGIATLKQARQMCEQVT
jgi:DNA polymerase III subunit epsilon